MFLCLQNNTQLIEKTHESPYKASVVFSLHWQYFPIVHNILKIVEK